MLFQAGETAVCSISIYNSAGALVDPATSVTISIWDEAGTKLVDAAAMTNDGVGLDHYNYTTPATGVKGQYKVIYTATDGALITKCVDYFQLE